MDLIVLDLETTGVDPAVDRVVELAWCRPSASDVRTVNRDPQEATAAMGGILVDPGRDIPPEASAVHHIREVDVAGAPILEEALAYIPKADAYVAHNSRFDVEFLPVEFRSAPWIDTYRAALWTWPDAPGHSNQCLRYWLELDDSDLVLPPDLFPHRALFDALTTAGILRALLRIHPVEQLLEWSKKPALLPRVTFGKFGPGGDECGPDGRGLAWSKVRRDYLEWMFQKDKNGEAKQWDQDVEFTARYYLDRFRAAKSAKQNRNQNPQPQQELF